MPLKTVCKNLQSKDNNQEVLKMSKIEIFDPAMCCSTGVCGPSVDPELVRVAADVEALKKRGASISRYNLSQDLEAFAKNLTVTGLLKSEGPEVLPVVIVDGEVKKTKSYATSAELSEWTGISAALPSIGKKPLKTLNVIAKESDSCTPGSGCC
jgi:hypothetical protein